MDILIKAAQFFLCLSLLVGIHEFGHFIMARIFKIRVEKFYIFFDPWFSLFKWKKGETEYGVGWLPLGGYVKIAGMVDESMDKEQMAQPVQPDEFRAKPAWQRLLVMIAGVVMNLLLAAIIYIGISYTWGETYISNSEVEWGYNFNDSAEALGFEDGDKLIALDGEPIDNIASIVPTLLITDSERTISIERAGTPMDITISLDELVAFRESKGYVGMFTPIMPFIVDSTTSESSSALLRKGDQIVGINGEQIVDFECYTLRLEALAGGEATLDILRGGELMTATLPISAEGKIGVMPQNPFELSTTHYTFWQAIPAGIRRAGNELSAYWNQLKMIVNPDTKLYKEVGGFIAIGSIFAPEWNWLDFWSKAALISIMLAVLNILPIPGLDGGHSLFTLWEMITGRKPSDKFMERVQTVGMLLLIALALYANGNDILRLFTK